ncbi:hypothetical protein ABFS82_03G048700 [Erythranthe guttata]
MELHRESILNQTDISFSLAKQLISTDYMDKNVIFSPLSIHILLGMIAAGSKGPTQDEMLGFFKSSSIEELNSLLAQHVTKVFANGQPLGGPRLSLVNGVWVDQSLTFKPSYKEIVENGYKAATYRVDFQTQAAANAVIKKVNKWVEKETNGLIKKILPRDSVKCDTRLILANAVYFKGKWKEKFDASRTKKQKFFLLNGSSIKVPFMTSRKTQYIRYFEGFKVLGLPYKQGEDKRRFSMYIFLPDAKDGLPSLIEKAGSESGFIEKHILLSEVNVGNFLIPKFKMEFEFEATKVLKELGMVLPFSSGDLTEMVYPTISTEEKSLFVSSIIHKAFVEVNEKGTEAAAVSIGVFSFQCSRRIERKFDFVADHPFMFVIREDVSGMILFIGQLLDPSAS